MFKPVEPIKMKERASKLKLLEKVDELIAVVNTVALQVEKNTLELASIRDGFARAKKHLEKSNG
jgi:hypothetical protein